MTEAVCKFHCGDRVFDKIEPRHVGTVMSVDVPFVNIQWKPGLESRLPMNKLALESRMLDPKIDWDDAGARFRLIEEIGPAAYKVAFDLFRDQSLLDTINGHALRRVRSRFGTLVSVDGTNRAFYSRKEAEDYARSLPTMRRVSYVRAPNRAPTSAPVVVHGAPKRLP